MLPGTLSPLGILVGIGLCSDGSADGGAECDQERGGRVDFDAEPPAENEEHDRRDQGPIAGNMTGPAGIANTAAFRDHCPAVGARGVVLKIDVSVRHG